MLVDGTPFGSNLLSTGNPSHVLTERNRGLYSMDERGIRRGDQYRSLHSTTRLDLDVATREFAGDALCISAVISRCSIERLRYALRSPAANSDEVPPELFHIPVVEFASAGDRPQAGKAALSDH